VDLTYLQAVVLGLIQGLAEFLPISSSGHLAVAQSLMGLAPESQPILLFDVASHVATVAAVLIFFARPVRDFSRQFVADFRRLPAGAGGNAFRIGWLGFVACLPTAAIGLLFKDELEAAFGKAQGIGISFLVTGALLAITAVVPRGGIGWRRFAWWQAALVGFAQGVAILPGVSRSGATICTALYLGLKRRWAAQFSFLIAVPAIFGATLIKAMDIAGMGESAAVAIPWGPIALGSVVAFFTGLVSLGALVRIVRLSKLHYFSPYCFAVGTAVLVFFR
jgi:undecaprenyl-diphosphatase